MRGSSILFCHLIPLTSSSLSLLQLAEVDDVIVEIFSLVGCVFASVLSKVSSAMNIVSLIGSSRAYVINSLLGLSFVDTYACTAIELRHALSLVLGT